MNLFKEALKSQSYAVQGAALAAINQLDPAQALTLAKGFEKDNEGALTTSIITIYGTSGGDEQWPYVYNKYIGETTPQGKFNLMRGFASFTARVPKPEYAQQGIKEIKDAGVTYKKFGVAPFIDGMLNDIKAQRTKMGDTASASAADAAIKEIDAAK